MIVLSSTVSTDSDGLEKGKQAASCGSVLVGPPCCLALGRYSRCAASEKQITDLPPIGQQLANRSALRISFFLRQQPAYLHWNALPGQL
jgi:hypothetical protein